MKKKPQHTIAASAIASLLLSCIAIGCGRSLPSTVDGAVTFNGKAVPRGTIAFSPRDEQGTAAYAAIQSDGNYRLRTGQTRGLAPGDYIITIQATELQTREESLTLKMPKSIIPTRYADRRTSGLSAAVAAGANRIDLNLAP